MIITCRKWNEPETERAVDIGESPQDASADHYAHHYIAMETLDVVFVEVRRGGVWTLWRVELAAKRDDGWLYDTTLITPEDAIKELQGDAAYCEEAL